MTLECNVRRLAPKFGVDYLDVLQSMAVRLYGQPKTDPIDLIIDVGATDGEFVAPAGEFKAETARLTS